MNETAIGQHRRRVPQAEAKAAMVDAAIEILHEHSLTAVTYRELAAHTGFNQSYVARYFGSLDDLLVEVANELGRRWYLRWNAVSIESAMNDPLIRLRVSLVQHLLATGVAADRFEDFESAQLHRLEDALRARYQLSPRALRAFRAKISLMVLAANSDMPQAFGIDRDTVDDVIALFREEREQLASIAEHLGW
ncbi:MAG: TetR family transcriptional regulator [Actinomycetota bacterium]